MEDMSRSRVFRFGEMPLKRMANGGESRDVARGQLVTGEIVAVHESMQVAGAVPNPAHRIEHTEIILVSEGTLEFRHDDKAERVGPGGVIYVSKGTMHSAKNVGEGAAKYFVVAIGGDVNT